MKNKIKDLLDMFKSMARDVGIEPALGIIYTFINDNDVLNEFAIELKSIGIEIDDDTIEYIGKSFGEILADIRNLDIHKAKSSKKEVHNIPVSKLKWVHRPKERKKLKKEGKVKFLGKNKEGEPCCPYTNKDGSINCRMLRAAESRATQHGYSEYAAKAKRLYERHCKKKSDKKD